MQNICNRYIQVVRLNRLITGFYLRKKVAGSTLKIEGDEGPRGGRAREGGVPLGGGGLRGHPQENFENWMMKYAISCYQGTIFAAVFKSLIVYLFVWKLICDVTITLFIRPSVLRLQNKSPCH